MAQYDEDEEMNQDEASSNDDDSDTEAAPAEEEEPTEQEATEEPEVVPAAPVAPQAPMAAPPSAMPQGPMSEADRAAQVRQYLQDKMANGNAEFAKASDMSAVKEAQEEARRKAKIAMWGEAFEGLAKSRSMARGGHGVDSAFYQGIANQGQQGVHDALELRQAGIQDYLQKQAIQDRVAQQMMAQGTFEQKQQAAAYERSKQDPTSQVSISARQALAAIDPNLASNEKLTANDIEKMGLVKAGTSMANKKVSEQIAADNRTAHATQHQDSVAARKDYQEGIKQTKEDHDLDKDEQALTQRLAGGRGTGEMNKNMSRAQAMDRILTLANTAEDPNKLSPQQVGELANALNAGIGAGGGSVETFKHIMPSSIAGDSAKMQQYLTGKVQSGNMGSFVEQIKHTAEREKKTALNNVKDSEALLTEGFDKLKRKRPDRMSEILKRSLSEQNAVNGPSQAISGGGKSSETASAHDSAAMEWAMSNPDDPRAKKIVELNSKNNVIGQK